MATGLQAELLATGDELMTGAISDTNGALAAARLREVGAKVARMTVVGDDAQGIEREVRAAAGRARVVVVCGGLGPTADDLTAAAVARAAGVELVRDAGALEHIRTMFAQFGVPMTPNNEKQADVPAGAEILDNPVGTAVGFRVAIGDAHVFCLPGVPHEYERMLGEQVLPRVAKLSGVSLALRVLRVYGLGESKLETDIAGIDWPEGVALGYRAVFPEIHLRLYSDGGGSAAGRLDAAEAAIRARIGDRLYARDNTTMAMTLGDLLRQRGWRMAVAESCTAGLLGAVLTEDGGASEWFDRGFTTYANEAKVQQVGVPEATIATHGAVSEATAIAMASGARRAAALELALSITGVAGPGGGTPEKPVGTVWIGLATAHSEQARVYKLRGDRGRIRRAATWAAMDLARRHLLELASTR